MLHADNDTASDHDTDNDTRVSIMSMVKLWLCAPTAVACFVSIATNLSYISSRSGTVGESFKVLNGCTITMIWEWEWEWEWEWVLINSFSFAIWLILIGQMRMSCFVDENEKENGFMLFVATRANFATNRNPPNRNDRRLRWDRDRLLLLRAAICAVKSRHSTGADQPSVCGHCA